MENKLIWAYFLQLSDHMWDDENTPPRGLFREPSYKPENVTDLAVWDEIVQFIASLKYNMLVIDVGDGVQYESHPDVSAPNAWSRELLQKKLAELRALGIEPIPKLNFSACHHTWLKQYRHMVSTEIYYKVCADLIAEVCELFGSPRLFHLGMDEENAPNQVFREMTVIRGEKLWWHDCHFLFGECEKHGARPWVWSDYMWYHPDLFEKYMPKSVMQSNWYYGQFVGLRDTDAGCARLRVYEKLSQLGYDQIPSCSTWANNINPYQTVAVGKNFISSDSLKGFMTIPWTSTHRDSIYTLQNDAYRLYLARKKLYPETL